MRKWIMGCALLVLLMVPNEVFADKICIGGNLYNVTSSGQAVNLNTITGTDIARKTILPVDYFYTKVKFGAESKEFKAKYSYVTNEDDYAIEGASLHVKCNRIVKEDGTVDWSSCPSKSQYSGSNAKYSVSKLQSSVEGFKFDEENGNFYIKVKDVFDSTLMVRVVRNKKENKENYDFSSARSLGIIGEGEFYELKSEGLTLHFAKGAEVILEFYINPSAGVECSGSYVGNVTTGAPTYADVKNPWKDSEICKNFKKGYSQIPTSPTNYKSLLVPECYRDTIDYFSEKPNISEATIGAKINEVSAIFSGESTSDISKLQCHYHTDGSREAATQTKSFIYNPSGSNSSSSTIIGDYWAASCTETVAVNYDQPKKLHAGMGFTYDAILTVTRTCTPIAIRKISQPEQCSYEVECWGGPANHTGQSAAGPNEDFDSCVSACDGGSYTKDCINACYSKVYEGKDVKIDLTRARGVNQSFSDVIQARQMASDGEGNTEKVCENSKKVLSCEAHCPTSPNYCYAQKGWKTATGKKTPLGSIIYEVAAVSNQQSNCNGTDACSTFHGRWFTYANGCNSAENPTMCYEVYTSKPRPDCSDNPAADQNTIKESAEKEYEALLAAIRKYEKSENFEMSIIDSYKTSGGKPLVTTSTSLENKVKVTGGVYTYPDTKLTYKETPNVSTQVYSNDGASKNVPSVEVKKEYKIELPRAVISQIDGKEKYVTNNYKKSASERDGGNKYYTDINSATYNDYRKWYNDYSPLDERADAPRVGNNIGVVFKNIGTVQNTTKEGTSYTWDKINLDCFYGLLNKRYIECDDGICPDLECDDDDVCTGGLQFMFRQINLTDVFPERDPRWNWTYTSEVDKYGYASRPKEVIEDIESLGESVFSSQNLDYEITITRENIRSIRNYNKSQKNYQNYDMNCSAKANGMEVCESKMLKNSGYVKSFQRNTELGSNN